MARALAIAAFAVAHALATFVAWLGAWAASVKVDDARSGGERALEAARIALLSPCGLAAELAGLDGARLGAIALANSALWAVLVALAWRSAGQRHAERRGAGARGHVHPAPVRGRERAHQREPEPRPA